MTDKILIERAVVEQALDALNSTGTGYEPPDQLRKEMLACRALRAALEQPQVEQEPVAYEFYNPATGHAIVDYSEHTHVGHLSADKGYIANPLFPHQQPQQEQIEISHSIEIECQKCGSTEQGALVVTTHPQLPRQPLTDEWIRMIYDECDAETGDEFIFAFARAIERAHGITGDQA